jgi:tetratricopeptide (TPR) repeat protein
VFELDEQNEILNKADSAGCRKRPEYRAAVQAAMTRDAATITRAFQSLQDLTAIKTRLDASVAWFDREKITTLKETKNSPEIESGFRRYDEAITRYGDNWYSLVPQLEKIQELLERALRHYGETEQALQELTERLEPWSDDSRFDYIEFRRRRLAGQFLQGCRVPVAEVQSWLAELVKLEEKLTLEEETQQLDSINDYLENQVSRFEETMTVADFKKLEKLRSNIDDPSSRMALWNLLREHEAKHATRLDMIKIKKPGKPKLTPAKARDGWEVLTHLSRSDDTDSRRRILNQMRTSLQKPGSKQARSGIDRSLKQARKLAKEDS